MAMRAEIVRFHRTRKASMVFVTHDQTEAMTTEDRGPASAVDLFPRPRELSRVAGSGRAPDRPDQCHEEDDRCDRQGRRDIPPPADQAGSGFDQRSGRRDLSATDGAVRTRSQLCGLPWACAATGPDRGKQQRWKTSKLGQRGIRRLLPTATASSGPRQGAPATMRCAA